MQFSQLQWQVIKMMYINFTDSNGKTVYDSLEYEFLVRNTADRITGTLSLEEVEDLVRNHPYRCSFYLYALYDDETVKLDLSDYVIGNGSLTINYNSGIRRNLSISVFNECNWTPHPFKGFLWKGSKFKLEIGIQTSSVEYVYSAGIFILKEFEIPHQHVKNVIKMEMVDKFGCLDGTVGGKIVDRMYIPRGSNIVKVVKSLLKTDKIEGVPFDTKTPLFPAWAYHETTPYTITETSESTIGALIKKLLYIINLDVFYDEYGRLCTEEMRENMLADTLPSLWTFNDDDTIYSYHTLKTDFQAVENVVVVEGANINGDIMSSRVENTNPKSPTNITIFEPKVCKITDENISSVNAAHVRASYELFKRSLLPMSESFSTVLIPSLNVNNAVTLNDGSCGLNNVRFLINSITIPITGTTKMDIMINNLEEVAFSG